MYLLAFHIISVSLVMAVTGYAGYNFGFREGVRKTIRRLEREKAQSA